MDLISIIEGLYVLYMFNFFKTRFSIHHPYEKLLTGDISNYLSHPIHSGRYENKICRFGNTIGYILGSALVFRGIYNPTYNIYQWYITVIILCGTLILNLNSFIYMIPVFIYECLLYKKNIYF